MLRKAHRQAPPRALLVPLYIYAISGRILSGACLTTAKSEIRSTFAVGCTAAYRRRRRAAGRSKMCVPARTLGKLPLTAQAAGGTGGGTAAVDSTGFPFPLSYLAAPRESNPGSQLTLSPSA